MVSSWKFNEYPSICYSVMLLTNTNPEIEKLYPSDKRTIPKMSQIVPRVTADLSWKFHENPFIHYTTLPRLDGKPWPSLVRHETLCQTYHENVMKIRSSVFPGVNCIIPEMFQIVLGFMSDLSWKVHENPSIRFPVMLQTVTLFAWKDRKRNPVSKGLNITLLRFS